MKTFLSLIVALTIGVSAFAQPQVAVNILGTNSSGGPGGFQVTSSGVAFSGTVTGITNLTPIFVGQFTNGSANTACASSNYYTNTFGRKITADLSLSCSNALGTGGNSAIYGYTAAGVARIPYYFASAGTNLITNTISYQLDPGGYLAVSNLTGTWLFITNSVEGF